MQPLNVIYYTDAMKGLRQLPDRSIDTVVTSPPYYGLRDYEVAGQIGLEEHPNEYIGKLVGIFRIVKKKLKKTGSLWLNLGDTYYGSAQGHGAKGKSKTGLQDVTRGYFASSHRRPPMLNKWDDPWLQPKQLMMIGPRVAIALQADGWILRNIIIWRKPNCMPSSAKDRFTIDFEYVFFFVKSRRYFFEKQYQPSQYKDSNGCISNKARLQRARFGWKPGKDYPEEANIPRDIENYGERFCPAYRNVRAVWDICPQPFKDAHFATFPEELCEMPIKAGCPELVCERCGTPKRTVRTVPKNPNAFNIRVRDVKEGRIKHADRIASTDEVENYDEKTYQSCGRQIVLSSGCGCNAGFRPGIVLDPFTGAGTTCLVAAKLGRNYIGFELNPNYVEIARRRLMRYHSERLMAIVNDAGRRNGRKKPRQMSYARMGA